MDILTQTFERHKQLLFESLYDSWEDRVDWKPIVNKYDTDAIIDNNKELDEIGKLKVKSITTKDFWKLYDKLPASIKNVAKTSYQLFLQDPYLPTLRFKKLKLGDVYSVNVGGSYRAIGIKLPSPENILTVKWIWIGFHGDYDNELHKLMKK